MRILVVLACFTLAFPALAAPVYEITGKTLQSDGTAVEGARIWLRHGLEVLTTESGQGGHFVFSEVPEGRAAIVAYKEGLSFAGVSADIVGPGAVTLYLTTAGAIRLRIVDHQFDPVFGASVKAMQLAGTPSGPPFSVPVEDLVAHGFPSYRTARDGFMDIAGLPEGGNVRFRLAHRHYTDTLTPPLPVGEEQDIQMWPGIPLRGRVTAASGQGVAGARLVVFSWEGPQQRQHAEAVTDPEGYYNATVAPGRYYVAVHHPNHASPRELTQIELKAGDEEALANIELLEPHAVTGTVVGPEGETLGGIGVAYLLGGKIYNYALTNREGVFQFTVPEGNGFIKVMLPFRMITEQVNEIPVYVEEGDIELNTPIRLKELPEIAGVVRDRDGAPVENALIASAGIDPPVWYVSGADGSFRIRLSYLPAADQISFTVDHPLRLQEAEFTVRLPDVEDDIEVKLSQYRQRKLENAPENLVNTGLKGLVGKPAPALRCQRWLNTEPLTIERLRGKVVVLTLWGAFDTIGPTQTRIEEMRALHAIYGDTDDVAIISVHDATLYAPEIEAYVRQRGIGFPVGLDEEPGVTFDLYDTNVIPQTVVIDKKGVLRYYDVEGRLVDVIKALRAEG